MKRLFVQLLSFAPVIAMAQSGFTIQGTIAVGKDPVEKVILSYNVDGAAKVDSVMVTDGKYAFKGQVSEQSIIDWSHEHMAAYKSPRIVQLVDSLPKSGTGKVQWRELQEQERSRAAGAAA